MKLEERSQTEEVITKEDYLEIYAHKIELSIQDFIENYIPQIFGEDEKSHFQGLAVQKIQDTLDYYKQTLPTVSWFIRIREE